MKIPWKSPKFNEHFPWKSHLYPTRKKTRFLPLPWRFVRFFQPGASNKNGGNEQQNMGMSWQLTKKNGMEWEFVGLKTLIHSLAKFSLSLRKTWLYSRYIELVHGDYEPRNITRGAACHFLRGHDPWILTNFSPTTGRNCFRFARGTTWGTPIW